MRKRIVLILVGLLVMVVIPAIAEEKPKTKLEQFIAKKGEIIIKEFYDVGLIWSRHGAQMKTTALVIYEPGASSKIYGLQIRIKEGGKYPKENISFLDFKEIESLSQALGYMIELSKKWASIEKEYTEVIFRTQGDYEIGFYQEGLEQSAFSESDHIGSASIYLGMENLEIFKSHIDKALAKLKSLGAE